MSTPTPSSHPAPTPTSGSTGRRTHPLTPFITGWKIIVGAVAVIFAQNVSQLMQEITLRRVLIGLGMILLAVVIGILLSAASWWYTSYEITEEGVALHHGVLSKSRRFAPREKIESVSVERPLLARLLGLAKVRVEIVGGSESHVDIEYVTSAEAEQIRRAILQVAHHDESAGVAVQTADGAAADGSAAADGHADQVPTAPRGARDRLREALHDGVTDGELIAEIPTTRVLEAMLRDISLWIGVVVSVLVGVGGVIGGVLGSGWSLAALIALVPALLAGPRMVFKQLEAGWGFVSRDTERGLRMRRGLLNTRTDNVAHGRIQQLSLSRPLLWRGPGWTEATVELAGTDGGEDGAEAILPVGTREELGRTLSHLMTPLGTADDLATIEHLLTARARDIEGLRATHRFRWIARRFRVVVPLPEAVVVRRGILARRLIVVPRERIQSVELQDGPLHRRLGDLDVHIEVAGSTAFLEALPRQDAARLFVELSYDAATRRRYSDQENWPLPPARRASEQEDPR